MTAQFARAPHQGKPAGPSPQMPHAALLIDFDNVTMGIRSDITKELKNLLNSDIIKGKVAVQRAYADWRRYPQYVVPLAEGSVDLIFAPAYGSSKKNATDIRLSIDALELVFTRPEIGTFILLSGDSDFSSLVLKLKEYGKYVVGVGIRESASDLLVQNCDEYYSYSALTGLTRAGEEEIVAAGDPWELVELAVQQMVNNGDVMRSDRLKQVLLELDPNFDEKTLGFSKFNRFVAEASNRGLLRLHKLENGQFEIALADSAVEEVAKPDRQARGRRRSREPREPRESTETADRTESTGARVTPESEAGSEPARPTPPERRPTEPHVADGRKPGGDPLRDAYGLLTRAAHELGATIERAVRDSDLKRRMLDFEPDWDESSIGFSKFSRFLRQAHDAEVINLRKIDSGAYEVALPGRAEAVDEKPAPEDGRSERRPRADRGRRGPRRDREEAVAMQSAMELEPAPVVGEEPTQPAAAALPATAPQPAPPPAAAPRAASPAPTTPVGLRRGSRSPRLGGAPPLLEGQVVATSKTAAAASGARRPDPQPRAPAITELGLPRDRDAIIEYVTKSYKGIGQKTAESLVDATGVDRFFATLNDAPDRVKEIIGAKRGETLLEAWHDDYAARLVAARGTSASPAAPGGNAGDGGKPNGGRRGGRRRGGRGRKRPATAKG